MSSGYRSPRKLIESGAIAIPELFEWNAEENPEYPLFCFPNHSGAHRIIPYAEAIRAIRRVARYVLSFADNRERRTIAILANTDSVTYTIASVGILRAGHILFPISTRNGTAAVTHLLERTNCQHVLVSEDEHMQALATESTRDLTGIALHPILKFEDMFTSDALSNDPGPEGLPTEYAADDVAMILHSSGSTNHPKPILWTHKRLTSRATAPWYGEVDMTGTTLACAGTPMFHAQGVSFYTTTVTTGIILGVFVPSSPPIFPTPVNVFDNAVATGAEYISTVPTFVEEWARDPGKVDRMRKMKGVIFGGAEMNAEVGNSLASRGISLILAYGITEIGAVANIIPGSTRTNPSMDWGYFSITPWIQSTVRDAGDGKFEIVVLQSSSDCPLPVVNLKIDGVDAYATNDLVIPHPTRKGLWKLYGRMDEQIVLSNGEKTNPIPIERIIKEDVYVRDCIVFGSSKFQNGVLVEPEPAFAVDPHDQSRLSEFRSKIWPSVERANAYAPQHSRIFKEMIIVASPLKPFDYNAKGNIRRNPILQRYTEEIEALYDAIQESTQSDLRAPAHWDPDSARTFVRAVVHKVLLKPLDDTSDIFRSGCDSLQATWIRNTILRALRQVSSDAATRAPVDFVYRAPTITKLTDTILSAINRSGESLGTMSAEDLLQTAKTYSSDLNPRPAQRRQREPGGKDGVLITGTTNGFGCDVLERLLVDDRISIVYAFNRRDAQAMARQCASFRARGLDEGKLNSSKFVMVEVELDRPGFGIHPELLHEIRESVTHIIHNAWKVDFNLALASYEVDLKAVRNLVELALSSPYVEPPRIQFISSVGVLRNCTVTAPIAEVPLEPLSALGTGYSEAKWIAEQVLFNVAKQHDVPVTVVRLGQVCGDRLGHWNEKEWFPALVKSAVSTGCLPVLEAVVSFIPSYPAAQALLEMRSSPSPVLHLVHPHPVAWRTLLEPIADELGVPLVPFQDWLAALEECDSDPLDEGHTDAVGTNPALRLLGLFRSWTSGSKSGPVSGLRVLTDKAEAASETLRDLPHLEEEVARSWIAAWRRSGFLPQQVVA
ncbi:acetyl-CoA synthetase-like protein [Dichomitus squalens]|uniref:Acetyl-CoA synthetase-like protein n=1 Tax=Dichomitus squalens TaxID=114155 RepID=A0A4Q9MRI3_9APHY|nr:acetyl-CoA synthetase-like protein [Dichomitus squalens]